MQLNSTTATHYGVPAAARILGVSASFLRKEAREGRITILRQRHATRPMRIRADELERYMKEEITNA